MKAMATGIERFEAFRHLTGASKALLSQGLMVKSSHRAAAVLHKGQPVSGAYIVLEGRLRVFSISPSGAEATLYFVGPGETCVLALNCLFNDLLYPAWVQAETTATVAVIPGPVYKKLFETEPGIQDLTIHSLSTLVYRLMSELEQVHSRNYRQRLAQFILLHSAADGSLQMTQQQIARHLGTTREVIARLVQEFVSKGFIKTRRGAIAISDLFGLRGLVTPPGSGGKARKKTG